MPAGYPGLTPESLARLAERIDAGELDFVAAPVQAVAAILGVKPATASAYLTEGRRDIQEEFDTNAAALVMLVESASGNADALAGPELRQCIDATTDPYKRGQLILGSIRARQSMRPHLVDLSGSLEVRGDEQAWDDYAAEFFKTANRMNGSGDGSRTDQ